MREHWIDAAGWLEASIRSAAGRWSISEGYARKDRALLSLAEDQVEDAEAEAQKAEDIFRSVEFREGLAHVNRTCGMIRARQGRFDEAKQKLRAALRSFRPFQRAGRRSTYAVGDLRVWQGPPASHGHWSRASMSLRWTLRN